MRKRLEETRRELFEVIVIGPPPSRNKDHLGNYYARRKRLEREVRDMCEKLGEEA